MSLEFVINLGGNFTGALKDANEKLKGTEKGSKEASEGIKLFEGELGNLSGTIGGLGFNFAALSKGGHFFTFDLAEGLRSAVELGAKLVETFVDLGKEIVGVAGKRQDLDLAIKLNVGEAKKKELDELAERFEKQTRFDESDIKSAWLPLLQQGLGKDVDQLAQLTTAATDYAARMNLGATGVQSALEMFSKIALKGQVNFKMLAGFGITEADYIKDLSTLRHESAKTTEGLMKQGKIDKAQLLNVAMNQIQLQQGGSLGGNTLESAKTLGATLQKLGHLKENLFEGLADSAGMRAVQGFLDNFLEVMGGETGKQLVATLGKGFEAVFGDLSGANGLEKVRNLVTTIAEKVTGFVGDFRAVWPEIQAGFEAAVPVFVKFAQVLGGIAKVMGALPRVGEAIGDWMADHDPFMDKETRAAFRAARDREQNTVTERFEGDSGSKSKDASAWSGSMVPAMADGGIVDRPTLALVGEAGPEAVIPLSQLAGAGGGSTFGDVIVNIPAGTSASDAATIGQLVRAEVERSWFEAATARGAR